MAQSQKPAPKPATKQVTAPAQAGPTAAQAAPATAAPAGNRQPLPQAKAHNSAIPLLAKGATVTPATVVRSARGTNPKRTRYYGYGNAAHGGGIPAAAGVAIGAGITQAPKGVNPTQWASLVAAVKANPNHTVQQHKAAGIQGRTLRRAYRAGAIRFVVVA